MTDATQLVAGSVQLCPICGFRLEVIYEELIDQLKVGDIQQIEQQSLERGGYYVLVPTRPEGAAQAEIACPDCHTLLAIPADPFPSTGAVL